ncbi:MAG: hypothetical protein UY76_C0043G0008 [Candidatus Uhrbacteria bacterium GW2011_GWA2_52_8d]|uniref:Uncharacterized protein n=1 Tax=Candidatus Uhrbacteria bacterium GW2011_GWA2_52_8d TaxID=1618979 RepID=A0A0G1XLB3_9BACT|nr:MAG: hypothetical protein UY76_C0043G0008 [Candidatus Uhrbacteria bacterium GW2011_GWA2_52_8d]
MNQLIGKLTDLPAPRSPELSRDRIDPRVDTKIERVMSINEYLRNPVASGIQMKDGGAYDIVRLEELLLESLDSDDSDWKNIPNNMLEVVEKTLMDLSSDFELDNSKREKITIALSDIWEARREAEEALAREEAETQTAQQKGFFARLFSTQLRLGRRELRQMEEELNKLSASLGETMGGSRATSKVISGSKSRNRAEQLTKETKQAQRGSQR